MLITDLDDDVMRGIALEVIANGNAYWFATTAAPFAKATRAVARDAKEKSVEMKTHVSTCFQSMTMLRKALRVTEVKSFIVGHPFAYGYQALVQSFDKRYRWTPRAMVHAFSVSPFTVLDYMSPNWRRNESSRSLYYASAAGRITALEEIVLCDERFCGMVEKMASTKAVVLPYFSSEMFTPSIRYGATKTLQWLLNRLTRVCPDGMWRTRFGDASTRRLGEFSYTLLAAAVQSKHAMLMLNYITGCVIPQAIQPTELARGQLRRSLIAVVLALSASTDAHVDAWRWLKINSANVYVAWAHLDVMTNRDSMLFSTHVRIDARNVWNNILVSGNADVFRWHMQETIDGGWLQEMHHWRAWGMPQPRTVCSASSVLVGSTCCHAFSMLMHERSRNCFGDVYKAARVECILNLNELAQHHVNSILDGGSVQELSAMVASFMLVIERWDELSGRYFDGILLSRWIQEGMLPWLVKQLTDAVSTAEVNWEDILQCLRSRSMGGLGACGAATGTHVKRSITASVCNAGVPGAMVLVKQAGLFDGSALREGHKVDTLDTK